VGVLGPTMVVAWLVVDLRRRYGVGSAVGGGCRRGSRVSFRKGAVEEKSGSRWAARHGSHRSGWTKKDKSST
jgi:hypothetical protein